MKDYKRLLIGLALLLLVIFIGVFNWLWTSNRKNIDPLPIMLNEHERSAIDDEDNYITVVNSIVYLQAEESLRIPLDDVIDHFESRYPRMQVLARYVPSKMLLTLQDNHKYIDRPSTFTINIDIIIADSKLTETRLSSIQTLLNDATTELNKNNANATINSNNTDVETDNMEARNLVPFSYAIKGEQAVDAVILTDNPVAVSFRNFLLSSAGQNILRKYDYDNIEGYRNNLDDLFNPKSGGKTASGQPSVKVADALDTGK